VARRPRRGDGHARAPGGAHRRPRPRHVLALGREAIPGDAPGGGRGDRSLRIHERGAGAGVRVALERAGSGGPRARAAREDRMQRAGSRVRAPPSALGARGARLRDAWGAPYGGVLELLREARGHAGARPPPRLAHGVLHPSRASRATALPPGSESLDRGRGRRRSHRDRRMRGGLLRGPAEEHGAGVCEAGDCGFRIADCGFEGRACNPQSCNR